MNHQTFTNLQIKKKSFFLIELGDTICKISFEIIEVTRVFILFRKTSDNCLLIYVRYEMVAKNSALFLFFHRDAN